MADQYEGFGGPLGFKDAAREIEAAAAKGGEAAEAAKRNMLKIETMLNEFHERWRWLLFARSK